MAMALSLAEGSAGDRSAGDRGSDRQQSPVLAEPSANERAIAMARLLPHNGAK